MHSVPHQPFGLPPCVSKRRLVALSRCPDADGILPASAIGWNGTKVWNVINRGARGFPKRTLGPAKEFPGQNRPQGYTRHTTPFLSRGSALLNFSSCARASLSGSATRTYAYGLESYQPERTGQQKVELQRNIGRSVGPINCNFLFAVPATRGFLHFGAPRSAWNFPRLLLEMGRPIGCFFSGFSVFQVLSHLEAGLMEYQKRTRLRLPGSSARGKHLY